MSDMIPPIRPVSRIEPIHRIVGIADMDPGLYQLLAISLVALFQRAHFSNPSITSSSLSLIPLIGGIQGRNDTRRKKKYSKKDTKDFRKITSFLKERLEDL